MKLQLFCLFASLTLGVSQIAPGWKTESNGVTWGSDCDFWVGVFNVLPASSQETCFQQCLDDARCTHLFFWKGSCTLKNGKATLEEVKGAPSGSICASVARAPAGALSAISCPPTHDAFKAIQGSLCSALNPCTYSDFSECPGFPDFRAENRTKYLCLNGRWEASMPAVSNTCPTSAADLKNMFNCPPDFLVADTFSGLQTGLTCTNVNSCIYREERGCRVAGAVTNKVFDTRYKCSGGRWVKRVNTLAFCGTPRVVSCPATESGMFALMAQVSNSSLTDFMNRWEAEDFRCDVAALCTYGSCPMHYFCEGVWKRFGGDCPALLKMNELKKRGSVLA